MEIIFIKALKDELEDALHFFKLASQSLTKKQVSQWNYWVDPPEEKIKWVKEGFDKGEFFFVYEDYVKLLLYLCLIMYGRVSHVQKF